jgi:hypothetical protein
MRLFPRRETLESVFFGRNKRRASANRPTSEVLVEPPEQPRNPWLEQWRRCEQRVNRTWNAWQASSHRDSGRLYSAFVNALAEEERAAAEVQRRAMAT